MPPQGSNLNGPLSIKEGGLRLFDPIRVTNRFSDERFARLVLTPAQITTPFNVQIAPAPGAGKYYEFIYGSLLLKYGGVAYSAGQGNLRIQSGTLLSANVAINTFDGVAEDCNCNIPASAAVQRTAFLNQPLMIFSAFGTPQGNFANGNGSLILQINYRIMDSVL